MIAGEALRWTLAGLLVAATLYSAWRGMAAAQPTGRVDSGLHALMTAAMAIMLVPGGQWPVLPQVLLFSLGAWWFVVQAVRRPTPGRDGSPPSGPAKPLYDAAAMAAMAFMLAATGLWGLPASAAVPPPRRQLISLPHHGGSAAAALAAPDPAWSAEPALMPSAVSGLAIVFGLATVLWTARLLLQFWPGSEEPPVRPAIRSPGGWLRNGHSAGFRDLADTAVEVVGAAALALMFAALAA